MVFPTNFSIKMMKEDKHDPFVLCTVHFRAGGMALSEIHPRVMPSSKDATSRHNQSPCHSSGLGISTHRGNKEVNYLVTDHMTT